MAGSNKLLHSLYVKRIKRQALISGSPYRSWKVCADLDFGKSNLRYGLNS